MLGFFPKQTVSLPNFPDEQWSFSRVGRTKEVDAINSKFQALVPKNTNASFGMPVTSKSEIYFVTTVESTFVNTVCQLRKTNCTVDIYKVSGSTASGFTKSLLFTGEPSFQRTVSDNMRLYDAGLLSTTVKKFILPVLNITLTNRIVFNGINYSINAIDNSKYENLLEVQVEPDKRNAK
jgi:hypothetical protein